MLKGILSVKFMRELFIVLSLVIFFGCDSLQNDNSNDSLVSSDYFSISMKYLTGEKGDYWNYSGNSVQSKILQTQDNWRYYSDFAGLENIWLWMSDTNLEIYAYTGEGGILNFGDLAEPVGTVFDVNEQLCTNSELKILFKNKAVKTFAGTFENTVGVKCGNRNIVFEQNAGVIVASDNCEFSDNCDSGHTECYICSDGLLESANVNGEIYEKRDELFNTEPEVTNSNTNGMIVENLAPLASVSVFESYTGFSKSNLIDKDRNTFWYSNYYYQGKTVWFQLDWDNEIFAEKIKLDWAGNDYAKELDLWIHESGEWVKISTYSTTADLNVITLNRSLDGIWVLLKQSAGQYYGLREVFIFALQNSCISNSDCGSTVQPEPEPEPEPENEMNSSTSCDIPERECYGSDEYCSELVRFSPDNGNGYNVTHGDRYSWVRRDTMMLIKYAAASVSCKFDNTKPLGLGDMSMSDGSTPEDTSGHLRHPSSTHDNGRDVDIAYYQTGTQDNSLRAVCDHQEDGSEKYHCVSEPYLLDIERTTYFLLKIIESSHVRVIGVDGKIGLLLSNKAEKMKQEGLISLSLLNTFNNKVTYEVSDDSRGWYLFHHHHLHLSTLTSRYTNNSISLSESPLSITRLFNPQLIESFYSKINSNLYTDFGHLKRLFND